MDFKEFVIGNWELVRRFLNKLLQLTIVNGEWSIVSRQIVSQNLKEEKINKDRDQSRVFGMVLPLPTCLPAYRTGRPDRQVLTYCAISGYDTPSAHPHPARGYRSISKPRWIDDHSVQR